MSAPPIDFKTPIFTPTRTLKVICIGAGASGLLVAYKLQRHFDDFELTVYEKNKDISGTWIENRYPGCACDIPSHCYTWSFEPKTDWSGVYASSDEIFSYFKGFSDKYGLGRYIKLEHQVTGAIWDEARSEWDVEILDTATGKVEMKSCHVLVNAGGILNAWRYPAIPGLDGYKGTLVHSAAWPEGLDLKGKVVGLIGNGSSGIQILPAIQPIASKIVNFIREPTWIGPPIGDDYRIYTAAEKAEFAAVPEKHLSLRRGYERRMNGTFPMFFAGSEEQKKARAYFEGLMGEKMKGLPEELKKKLVPQWSTGCRRLTPGVNYLESLGRENVETVYGEIARVSEMGCVMDDGQEYPTDVLICATGFDTTFKPRFPLIGRGGRSLAELWKDEPRGYFGFAAAGFPNYMMTLGPNCPIGNGPVLPAIEAQVEYIIKMLSKFQKENLRSFDISSEAVDDFTARKDQYMDGTVWAEECRSWYKSGNARGKVSALWPGSTLHYLEAMETPRYEDWKYTYGSRNRFDYLGNGTSSAETRTGDLTYYIRNSDDSRIDPCLKRSKL